MARYIGPKHRLCRREGMPLCGDASCPQLKRQSVPGQHGPKGQRRKISSFGLQLREKQKAKRIYGVLERQFKRYMDIATRRRGETGVTLLKLLETRLDNVVYRLGLAKSRPMARQFVTHGHVMVNGKRTTIPSYTVAEGETIQLHETVASVSAVKEALSDRKAESLPDWLERKAIIGHIKRLPNREEIDGAINEHLIVEYYSR